VAGLKSLAVVGLGSPAAAVGERRRTEEKKLYRGEATPERGASPKAGYDIWHRRWEGSTKLFRFGFVVS
jgi:hypothetical protein